MDAATTRIDALMMLTVAELSWVGCRRTEDYLVCGQAAPVTAVIRDCLAPLTEGTERQIAAAQTHRTIKIAQGAQRIKEAEARGVADSKILPFAAKLAKLAEITSAVWWMDHNNLVITDLCKLID